MAPYRQQRADDTLRRNYSIRKSDLQRAMSGSHPDLVIEEMLDSVSAHGQERDEGRGDARQENEVQQAGFKCVDLGFGPGLILNQDRLNTTFLFRQVFQCFEKAPLGKVIVRGSRCLKESWHVGNRCTEPIPTTEQVCFLNDYVFSNIRLSLD